MSKCYVIAIEYIAKVITISDHFMIPASAAPVERPVNIGSKSF